MSGELFLFPLPLILLGWALAGGSPGPSTLTISATSMAQGRAAGLMVASGVVCGSAIWGGAAALGFSAVMLANAWLFEGLRVVGALYLLWLAVKSLRAAWRGAMVQARQAPRRRLFAKGLLLHLTNPKAILAWGSVYAVAMAPEAGPVAVAVLFACLSVTSMCVFWGYAVLFSSPWVAAPYMRAKRVFDAGFGVLFGAAALSLLISRAP